MIIDQLFTQPLFEDIADPNRLIVSVTIQPMSTGGEPMQKEIDLTGQFQGNTRSQMEQAMDYLTKMLESKGLNFTTLQARYQGSIMNQNNQGTMAPQSDWEREAEAKAAQMRARRPAQNATPAIKEGAADPITQFASNAHEAWRRNFDPTGTKPRIKKNSDGTEGDINVPFADLHPDWQKENLAAGRAAQHAVKHFGNNMEKAAEFIHRQWMKRNPKADYNAAQHVPYDDLSDDEKEKDRVHVRTMMRLMGHHPKQGVEEVAPPGAKAERMVKHIKAGYARDGKLTPKEKGIAFATAWKAHNAGQVEEGEVTKNATGLKHRATDKYGAGDDEPHHYTGGRSGFSEPGKYARDLEHVNKQLVKDLDASMGISWKNRGPKGLEVDEAAQGHTIEAHGIRGMDRRTWHKTFRNTDQMMAWAEKHDAEIIGTRDLEQARHHNLSPAGQQGVAEGLTEMDKSEPSAGRDTGPREGPEKIAKPITKEKMVKHALDALAKSMAKKDDKKKDVKESDTLMIKLKRAMVREGRVKELADDLKTMSDADFMKKYGKAKAAIRKDMKRVDEAIPLDQLRDLAGPESQADKDLAAKLKQSMPPRTNASAGKKTVNPLKPLKEGQPAYTPQEMSDILSGKKTQQQVDAERNKRERDDAFKKWTDAERDATRVDSQGRRIDKNGNLLPPAKAEPIPNAPLNPPPGYYKMKNFEGLNELSTNKLAQYKTAAAKDAKAADQSGDFKRGDKRLSGMVQATKKQFDNDAKKVEESRAARRALMARIVNSR